MTRRTGWYFATVQFDDNEFRCFVKDDGPRRDADEGGCVLEDWERWVHNEWVPCDPESMLTKDDWEALNRDIVSQLEAA